MIPKHTAWIFLVATILAIGLQGCATVAAPNAAGIRELPLARIELEAPPFETSPRFAQIPSVVDLISRGSRVLGSVVQNALSFTGTRYRYGGSSPLTGFDCSGFVGYVFRESAGLELPRASYQMATIDGRKLSREELKAGDLVFFAQRKRVNHVGIYLGDNRFIHAPSTGGRVRTDVLTDNYWRRRFVNGKRVLMPDQVSEAIRVAEVASIAPLARIAGGAAEQAGGFGRSDGGVLSVR